jgi:plasmid stabilization system protein ParE
LRLTDASEGDLAEIWASIAREASEEIASRFVAAVEAAFEAVRYFPLAAPDREHPHRLVKARKEAGAGALPA